MASSTSFADGSERVYSPKEMPVIPSGYQKVYIVPPGISPDEFHESETSFVLRPVSKMPVSVKNIVEDDTFAKETDEEYDDLTPDIADEEDDPVLESFDRFEELAEDMSLTMEQAFMLYGSGASPLYNEAQAAVTKIMATLDVESLDKMISVMEIVKKKKENLVEEQKTQNANEKKEKTKTLIKIKKGLQEYEIKSYIKQMNEAFTKSRTDVVDIYCPDWDDATTHHALIPACKKLLTKYCEMGLLGCLVNHNYMDVAQQLYCCAYVKGKLVDDKIKFQNIDINDYKIKVTESTKRFWMLIDGLKED